MAGIAEVAKKAGVKDDQVKAIFSAVAELAETERITIKDFGTFEVVTRAARKMDNPQDRTKQVDVPAKKVLTFGCAKAQKKVI